MDAQGQLRVTFPQHPDVIATVTGLADTATRGRVVAELRVTGNPFIREQRLRLARVDDARLIALVWSVQSTDEIPSGPLALTYEADACQSPHPGGCFDYASLQLRASDGAQAVQVPAGTRAQLGDYEVINGSSLVAVSEIGCTDLSGQSYAGAIRALR